MGLLMKDKKGNIIQGFSPDPNFSLGSKAAGTVFKKGTGGDVDISLWKVIEFDTGSATNGTISFNNDGAKIRNLEAGKNVIVIHTNVSQITLNTASAIVNGM